MNNDSQNEMQKAILIAGGGWHDRARISYEIIAMFQPDEVCIITYRGDKTHNDPFIFHLCTQNTKVVVFTELSYVHQCEPFFNMVTDPISVKKKMMAPFTINPKIILVCQEKIEKERLKKLGESFHRRFTVINC